VNQPQFNQPGREKLKQGYPFARKDAEGQAGPTELISSLFPDAVGCTLPGGSRRAAHPVWVPIGVRSMECCMKPLLWLECIVLLLALTQVNLAAGNRVLK